MPFVQNTEYVAMPFCTESSTVDFYSYSTLKDLAEKCQVFQENLVTRCRTVGIFQSDHGKFFLVELDVEARKSSPAIRLSLLYLKTAVPSTTMPTPVQVFGFLQWKNRPIIYVKILQVLNVPMALRIRRVMNTIANTHTAKQSDNHNVTEYFEDTYS